MFRIAANVLLAVVFPLAARSQDAYEVAAWAPPDAAVVIAWAGADHATAAFSASDLGKLWQQRDIHEFLTTPAAGAWTVLTEKVAADIGAARTELLQSLLSLAWRQPGMVCVTPVSHTADWPLPFGVLAEWRVPDGGDKLAAGLVAWIAASTGRPTPTEKIGEVAFTRLAADPPVYFGQDDGRWIVAIGKPAAERRAQRTATEKPFTASDVHSWAAKALRSAPPFFYTCVDLRAARELALDAVATVTQAVSTARSDQTPASSDEIEDRAAAGIAVAAATLGLPVLFCGAGSIGSVEFAAAAAFDGRCLRTSCYARRDEAHPLAFDFFSTTPVDPAQWKRIPPDAIGYGVLTFDAVAMYRASVEAVRWYWTEIDRRLPAAQKIGAPGDLFQSAREALGLDLEKDLLAHLGPHWVTYSRPGPVSFAFAIDVRNREAVQKQIDRLLKLLSASIRLRQRETEGVTVHVVDIVPGRFRTPISPCWALTDDRLILSPDFNTLRDWLKPRPEPPASGSDGGAAGRSIAALLEAHKGQMVSALVWTSEEEAFTPLFASLSILYPMAADAAASAEPRIRFLRLPPPTSFTQFMGDSVATTIVDGPVRITQASSHVPLISNAFSPSSVTTAAMGVAVIVARAGAGEAQRLRVQPARRRPGHVRLRRRPRRPLPAGHRRPH